MAELSAKRRKNLPDRTFAIPEERKYPITDRRHAANALARVAAFGTPEEQARVKAAVKKKYPDMPSVQE